MSRIGKMPIQLPKEVKISGEASHVEVAGPKGRLSCNLPLGISFTVDDGKVLVRRENEERASRALHGLARSLIANMVTGVTKGFEKRLEIIGIGFRADLQGGALKLTLGFSHPVLYSIPEGIKAEVEKQTAQKAPLWVRFAFAPVAAAAVLLVIAVVGVSLFLKGKQETSAPQESVTASPQPAPKPVLQPAPQPVPVAATEGAALHGDVDLLERHRLRHSALAADRQAFANRQPDEPDHRRVRPAPGRT